MFEHGWFDVKVVPQSCCKSFEEMDNFSVAATFLMARLGAECYVSLDESTQQTCTEGVVVVVVAPVVPRV